MTEFKRRDVVTVEGYEGTYTVDMVVDTTPSLVAAIGPHSFYLKHDITGVSLFTNALSMTLVKAAERPSFKNTPRRTR
ncbi:hypothetical protein PSH03_005415 [Micromonospora sp. PSH03]|uniref:hypothetical protein n=1 Tax=Micromonospora salmantinae TaxID=2911211 RepID=UPI001EE94B6A|nr:hypothetical protein [Micromonospora salmantinae]MCG5459631.1 hypothetical protein [Micromonospora salmantinae]